MGWDGSDVGFSAQVENDILPKDMVVFPGRALVKVHDNSYKGRIFIPPSAQAKRPASSGIVVAVGVGPIVDWMPDPDGGSNAIPVFGQPAVHVGETVFFSEYSGLQMKFNKDRDSDYRLIKPWEEVLCVYTEDEESPDAVEPE